MFVRALAGYILRGRMQAIGVTSLLSLLSLLFPPLAYLLSGVPIALVTLRKGPAIGIQVMLGSLLLIMAMLLVIGITPLLALSLVMGVWLPVVFCAVYLRRSAKQAVLLLAAATVAAVYAALMYLLVGDVGAWWQQQLAPQLERALQGQDQQQVAELLTAAAPYINGLVAAGLAFSMVVTVLIARWWQSMLFQPGGFGQEFRAIAMPRAVAAATMIAMLGALLLSGPFGMLLRDWVFVAIAVFLFQGLAVCHAQVRQRGWGTHWLWALYVLLLLLPQTLMLVSSLGFADAWLRGSQPRIVENDHRDDEDDAK